MIDYLSEKVDNKYSVYDISAAIAAVELDLTIREKCGVTEDVYVYLCI